MAQLTSWALMDRKKSMSVQSSDACATPRATSRTERAAKAMAAELLPMGERDDRRRQPGTPAAHAISV